MAALIALLVLLASAGWLVGWAGVGYGGLLVLACLPGVPIARAISGPRHPAGLFAGVILGYSLAILAFWTALLAGRPGRLGVVAAWLVALGTGALVGRLLRRGGPRLSPWTRGDTLALVFLTLLTTAIATPPLARVGATGTDQSRLYRAYFTADFVWHMAVTAELAKSDLPPRNPFLASERLHYYWGYFVVPATLVTHVRSPIRSVENALKINAVASALLFVCAIYLLARQAVPSPLAAGAAVATVMVASSAEGWYGVWRLSHDGVPLQYLRQLNIDGLSNWYRQGLRVDGLPRCFWYVPQHSMAYASGLVGLMFGTAGRGEARWTGPAVAGLALGASALLNPFVGGAFSLGYGLTVAFAVWRQPGATRTLAWHALAALPPTAAALWCVSNDMLAGAGEALRFGQFDLGRTRPWSNLFLSLGPILVPAAIGLLPRAAVPLRPARPAIVMVSLSLVLMHYVSLSVDTSWVAFRASQILLATVPALIARSIYDLHAGGPRRVAAAGLLAAVVVAGFPTTAIDWHNARDIANRTRSLGGFAWTIAVSPFEHSALEWVRRVTPPDAIVQMDPTARGRETWSLIPSFGERRMAAGLPISLLHIPAYDLGTTLVQEMYATPDAARAHAIARELRIDYIYAGGAEQAAYVEGMVKFAEHPELFAPVFHNSHVAIYGVRP